MLQGNVAWLRLGKGHSEPEAGAGTSSAPRYLLRLR